MPVVIQVTVSGDQEVIKMFTSIFNNIEPKLLKPYISNYAEDLRETMVKNMHRDSGEMANSTVTRPISGGRAVTVGVDYAEDENSRPGRKRSRRGTGQGTPHNFVEPAMRSLKEKEDEQLIIDLEHFLRTV